MSEVFPESPLSSPATATPGQAAREAFGELGADWYPGTPWNGLHEDLRAQWDAAAQAAITAALVGAGVANLHHDRDEARAERDACRQNNAAIAVHLDQYRDERDDARELLAVIRDRLGNLAAGLDLSAAATAPSRKSEIKSGCAAAVREIGASIPGFAEDEAARHGTGQ